LCIRSLTILPYIIDELINSGLKYNYEYKNPTKKDTEVTSKAKAELLAQLVRGKTLLREAPTRLDVVMHAHGIDIGRCERWQKLALRWELGALLASGS
jgi:hypothetical protein